MKVPAPELGLPVFVRGAWPVLGHIPRMVRDFLGLVREGERLHGPLFWVALGLDASALMCTHPDVFEVFKNRTTTSTHLKEIAGALLGDSLLVQDGAPHRHMRSAMNPPFTPKGLAATVVGPMMADALGARISRWRRDEPFEILRETREVALDIIFRVMGVPLQQISAWSHQYNEFTLSAFPLTLDLPGTPRWRGRRAREWIDLHFREIIADLRRTPRPGELLSDLVHAVDENGVPLSERELLDNLRLLALAGHDTTASTMAWMTIMLGRSGEWWSRLMDECRGADIPRVPDDLKRFPVAEAIFRETLRLYPPVANDSRKIVSPTVLCGVEIPPGVRISVPIVAISRHPDLYPDPDTFDPRRWLAKKEPIRAIELVQFGGGPHFCLGYHVAWMESVQFLVAMARRVGDAGLRPVHRGAPPAVRYMPLLHPDPKTRVMLAAG